MLYKRSDWIDCTMIFWTISMWILLKLYHKQKKIMCAPVNDDEKCIFNLCSFALKLQLTTTDRIIHGIRNVIPARFHFHYIACIHATFFCVYITHYTYLFVGCIDLYIHFHVRIHTISYDCVRAYKHQRLNGIGWLYEIYANTF